MTENRTSDKNFVKITSVGKGAAKVMKQGRNEWLSMSEFRHMTTSCFLLFSNVYTPTEDSCVGSHN